MKVNCRSVVFVAICLLVLVAQVASAQNGQKDPDEIGVASPTGNNCNAVPDNAYNGTLGSMACFTIAGPSGTVQNVDLQLGIDHTWAGDLTAKVVSPAGTVLTIFSRPGGAEPDDGVTPFCCGDSSDLISTSPLNFGDPLPNDPEQMGSTILGTQFICQDDGICDYFANPGAGPGTNFAQFIGENAAGNWMVCLGDGAAGDTGFICDPVLNISVGVPTMGRMALPILLILLIGASLLVMRRSALVG